MYRKRFKFMMISLTVKMASVVLFPLASQAEISVKFYSRVLDGMSGS